MSNILNKNIKSNSKLMTVIFIILIIAISSLILLPFLLSNSYLGHDLEYHIDTIRSLNEAWQNGTFGSRIYTLVGQDYGYGTGLFYSMIPSATAVILMNLFNIEIVSALYIEFLIIFALAGIIVFFFVKKLSKSNIISFVSAIVYVIFPYFLTNVYIRFAFSEIFLMITIPMIAWGIYELVENKDYRLFLPLFTIGYTLSILIHLSTTIYITIFVAIYICINFKKFFSEYRWIPFLISCLLVFIICATFYIPMLINYGYTKADSLSRGGGYLYWTTLDSFKHKYILPATIIMYIVYITFCVMHFKASKQNRDPKIKQLFIMSTCAFVVTTPLFFPWLLAFGPLQMLQFSWRLYSINALTVALMLIYIIKNMKKKYITTILVSSIYIISICLLIHNAYELQKNNGYEVYSENMISINSYLSNDYGLGGGKNGDYIPAKSSNEYIMHRANDSMIVDTNLDVRELANYQTINQLSFIVENSTDGYIVLNIPYDVCQGVEITQYFNYKDNSILQATNEMVDGKNLLRLNLRNSKSIAKIIINYTENQLFDNYLKDSPFEFIVLEGNATFTNFIKDNTTTYSVDITANSSARIEIPTLYYEGYSLTYTNTNGDTYTLTPIYGENGFIEVNINESGTLHVSFEGNYIKVANIISVIGIVLFIITLILCFAIPRKYFTQLGEKMSKYYKEHKTVAEILRFVICGGIATIVDMFTMGVVMYLMQSNIYPNFINVFINSPTPSTLATILGTSVGFIVGLIVNYILSIFFVFDNKGNSKTAKGFMIFTVLSIIGLLINIVGTYIGFDLLHLNQWLVKVIMVIIVLIYNYISKRLVLFKNKPNPSNQHNNSTNENNPDN